MINFNKLGFLLLFIGFHIIGTGQSPAINESLAKIKTEAFQRTQAMDMLGELTDVYGQRLTGSREYRKAAEWMLDKMKTLGLDNVHFENYCTDCRGWGIKSFNVEMVAPNFMNISAYPLALVKGTDGIVEGDVIYIPNRRNMAKVKEQYQGKLQGKVILLGPVPKPKSLTDTILKRYSEEELKKLADLLVPSRPKTPLPKLLDYFEKSDKSSQGFFEFVEKEGALAILTSVRGIPGILHPGGTYFYKQNDYTPLPYFMIAPEHFGRLLRATQRKVVPKIRLNLETEFYLEPENNVNIIGEITGRDSKLKSEVILIGGHFDSWHGATGATDNAASTVVLVEALRILKATGLQPKRTIRIGLWGGEEQAFLGSVSYAKKHFGKLKGKPNAASKKVSAYLNLDNGIGAIRGIYLQDNELARGTFQNVFAPLYNLGVTTTTIENTFSTDHETFDHYKIPSFQFIQDPLTYDTVTHHTNLDFLEYVPKEDLMKNAAIMAWTIYTLGEMNHKVARKK